MYQYDSGNFPTESSAPFSLTAAQVTALAEGYNLTMDAGAGIARMYGSGKLASAILNAFQDATIDKIREELLKASKVEKTADEYLCLVLERAIKLKRLDRDLSGLIPQGNA